MDTVNWTLKRKIYKLFGSQAAFAQKVKRSESDVSRIINGRKKLNEREAQKWQEILNP
jgi:plasmid maintenance system antidote protein VapI